jgi:hypothetical protein
MGQLEDEPQEGVSQQGSTKHTCYVYLVRRPNANEITPTILPRCVVARDGRAGRQPQRTGCVAGAMGRSQGCESERQNWSGGSETGRVSES